MGTVSNSVHWWEYALICILKGLKSGDWLKCVEKITTVQLYCILYTL